MNREESLKLIEQALENVTLSPYFGGNYNNDTYVAMDELELAVYRNLQSDNYELFNGISKCVLVLKGSDMVVKIPFNGAFKERWSVDGDTDVTFVPFTSANDLYEDAANWDYCENELLKYEKAQEMGFGKFFAHTEYYKDIKGHPIYLQEKVTPYSYEDEDMEPSEDARQKYNSSRVKAPRRTPEKWAAFFYDFYTEEEIDAFWSYAYRNELTHDLHGENVGYTQDGRPVLLDWADWREEDYYY